MKKLSISLQRNQTKKLHNWTKWSFESISNQCRYKYKFSIDIRLLQKNFTPLNKFIHRLKWQRLLGLTPLSHPSRSPPPLNSAPSSCHCFCSFTPPVSSCGVYTNRSTYIIQSSAMRLFVSSSFIRFTNSWSMMSFGKFAFNAKCEVWITAGLSITNCC